MATQLGNRKSKHLYAVEVRYMDNSRRNIEVHANTRDQARKIAEQFDVVVCSVNMIG